MKLTVLNIAYPFAPVRPDTAGGAEQILGILDKELVKAGYRSIVIAAQGSLVEGELFEFPHYGKILEDDIIDEAHKDYKILIDKIISKNKIDIVHMHGIDFMSYLPEPHIPVLVTLHLPVSWYPENIVHSRSNIFFNCVSQSQQNMCYGINNLLPYVENGIHIEELDIQTRKKNYALCLGRICPEKGYHLAIDAAKLAGIPLTIAGELYNYKYHIEYYKNEILTRLEPRKYKFIGSIGKERKSRLLASAKCLLVPSLVPETSSLVAMESIASGTPVIAFASGALPDIIDDGETGFIVNSVEEMANAISNAGIINPERCREIAKEKFSSGRMVKKYFSIYEHIIAEVNQVNHYDAY